MSRRESCTGTKQQDPNPWFDRITYALMFGSVFFASGVVCTLAAVLYYAAPLNPADARDAKRAAFTALCFALATLLIMWQDRPLPAKQAAQ